MDDQEVCPLCHKQISIGSEDRVKIRKKGAYGINKASIGRGVSIKVKPGTVVHKSCRKDYTYEYNIKEHKTSRFATAKPVKRSARLSTEPLKFDSKSDCCFCGNKVSTNVADYDYSEFHPLKTYEFVNTILEHCQKRNEKCSIDFYL